jgi:hypothetical protein
MPAPGMRRNRAGYVREAESESGGSSWHGAQPVGLFAPGSSSTAPTGETWYLAMAGTFVWLSQSIEPKDRRKTT